MGTYVKKKKYMNYQSFDSLNQVVKVINEASAALNEKRGAINGSAIPEVAVSLAGTSVGVAVGFFLIYYLGTVGLSAVGLTSGLAAIGVALSVLIGGIISPMLTGIFILLFLVALLAVAPTLLYSRYRSKKFRQEKERLYKVALQNHEGIIRALKEDASASKERMDYLQSINFGLQRAIKDLGKDLGVTV